MGEGDGGHATVGIPDECFGFFRLGGGVAHLAGFGESAGERLFTCHMFPGLQGGQGHFQMLMVGGGDVDQIDFRIGDRLFPVHRAIVPMPFFFEFFQLGAVSAADGMANYIYGQIEEFVDL